METIIALLLRIFSNPFSNVLQKRLTVSGCKPLSINLLTYVGLSILCIFPAYHVDFLNLSGDIWNKAILGGFCGALGNGFLIKSLERGDLSVLGPINSYKSIVAMLFAIFILGEMPSIIGLAGVLLIIFGSYFIFDTQKEGFSFALLKRYDIRYRILALIFTALEAVFIKNIIIESDVMTAFIFWCWLGALFSLVFVLIKREKIGLCKQNLTGLIFLIITTGTMQWSTNFVFNHMDVSYALALFQLSTILSVLFGWKIFAEDNIVKKLIGSLIMITGAITLILV